MKIASFVLPKSVWHYFRLKRILHTHSKVASICDSLISEYYSSIESSLPLQLRAKKKIETDKIIWQYWAQGFDNVPPIVKQCTASVDKWCGEYTVVRLDDSLIDEYLEMPPSFLSNKASYSPAHFSDILRLCLLFTYGGIWMDATIYLTGRIPDEFFKNDFFAFQRDPREEHKKYWENVYAYYFGWEKGFRVNVLNSFIYSRRGGEMVEHLCRLLLYYSSRSMSFPDYFFFQILFDVASNGILKPFNCEIVSDCLPHLLQQRVNDPSFNGPSMQEICSSFPIHKMTYKTKWQII